MDRITNYLDDFLFLAFLEVECNSLMETFFSLCKRIGCPLSLDKTEYATTEIVFLGMLLNGILLCLSIPVDKKNRAVDMLEMFLGKKKVTIKEIQTLTSLLNFLNRAIVPGRAFTRRMYAKLKLTDKKGRVLKQHHHVYLDKYFRADCAIWLTFLSEYQEASILCKPFTDLELEHTSTDLDFYTDASGVIGYGCFFNGLWTYGQWTKELLMRRPSIEFLELFAICAAILTWESKLANMKIIIYCDNQAVIDMINNSTLGCPACLKLVKILVLNCLLYNRRIYVRYVKNADNILADSLSRNKLDVFWSYAPKNTKPYPDTVPDELFPVEKFLTSS